MAHRSRWFPPRSDRMIPSQAALPYRRKLLMAITVWHVLFLQKDTFRTRALLSAAMALLLAPHEPMKTRAAKNDSPMFYDSHHDSYLHFQKGNDEFMSATHATRGFVKYSSKGIKQF